MKVWWCFSTRSYERLKQTCNSAFVSRCISCRAWHVKYRPLVCASQDADEVYGGTDGEWRKRTGSQLGIYDSRYVERCIPNKPHEACCTWAVVFVDLSGDKLL